MSLVEWLDLLSSTGRSFRLRTCIGNEKYYLGYLNTGTSPNWQIAAGKEGFNVPLFNIKKVGNYYKLIFAQGVNARKKDNIVDVVGQVPFSGDIRWWAGKDYTGYIMGFKDSLNYPGAVILWNDADQAFWATPEGKDTEYGNYWLTTIKSNGGINGAAWWFESPTGSWNTSNINKYYLAKFAKYTVCFPDSAKCDLSSYCNKCDYKKCGEKGGDVHVKCIEKDALWTNPVCIDTYPEKDIKTVKGIEDIWTMVCATTKDRTKAACKELIPDCTVPNQCGCYEPKVGDINKCPDNKCEDETKPSSCPCYNPLLKVGITQSEEENTTRNIIIVIIIFLIIIILLVLLIGKFIF